MKAEEKNPAVRTVDIEKQIESTSRKKSEQLDSQMTKAMGGRAARAAPGARGRSPAMVAGRGAAPAAPPARDPRPQSEHTDPMRPAGRPAGRSAVLMPACGPVLPRPTRLPTAP